MRSVLVTGASGFVGGAILVALERSPSFFVRALTRRPLAVPADTSVFSFEDLSQDDFKLALEGVECIVHAAARVHVLHETQGDTLSEYRHVNVKGTLNLARQAAEAGVKRFIFLSSVKVNGEQTSRGQPFSVESCACPADAYGISKYEAELALKALSAETGMEVVIIRPVLVYGPGVGANFEAMMKAVAKRTPLPLGAINNLRSLVALDNLVDLVITCIEHPEAANQTFLVSDDEDVSTSELLRRVGRALGIPARLLPVPSWLLKAAATILGKNAVAQRLCGSLQVDIGPTKAQLGWIPPVPLDVALQRTADHFRSENSR